MSHVTFIYPCVGRFPDRGYVRSWQMQPLSIGVLAALTPPDWQRTFYDDRLEPIDYDQPTDLAAISIETFTARRGYQIAQEYRRRRVPVVIGGYHASFCPEEVLEHADAVCVGEAEGVWGNILRDVTAGRLLRVYSCSPSPGLSGVRTDRGIFRGKNYFKIAMVETGRGCRFRCNFCSITAFYKATYRRRPVVEIIDEIRQLKEKIIFFVDDNVIGDVKSAKELFHALKPLGIQWIGQASVNAAADAELLDLMAGSGCRGLLVGFESLNPENLTSVGKAINETIDYEQALRAFRQRGILIYGTFMFGLPADSARLICDTVRFAEKQKLFLAALNHLVPFPGTPLYSVYQEEGRLVYGRWWLSDVYRFGQPPFRPSCMTSAELEQCCHQARRNFYALLSVLRRSLDFSANCANFRTAMLFFGLNFLLQREILQKRGLPLGVRTAVANRATHHVQVDLAKPGDDTGLRNLLLQTPMPGVVRLAYLREPSFFQALQVEGRYNDVVIGRDIESGQIIGLGSRSIKTAFVNGRSSTVGYLSGLRLIEGYRGSTYLARGYRMLRERHQDGRTKLYVTTIIESNQMAREILTSRRAGLPAYHDYGRFCCMAISLQQKPRPVRPETFEIRSAMPEDIPVIVEFWRREGVNKQFFPEYTAEDLLRAEGLLRGLELKNVLLAYSRSELVGTAAAWDQKSFRQSLVTGYNRQLTLFRLPYNVIARLLAYPILPRPGSYLGYINLSLICILKDNPRVFRALLVEMIRRYRSLYPLLMAGLHEQDPLLPVLRQYRHFAYPSRLYVAYWEDGEEDFENLDGRVPYLELGAL